MASATNRVIVEGIGIALWWQVNGQRGWTMRGWRLAVINKDEPVTTSLAARGSGRPDVVMSVGERLRLAKSS